MVLITACNQPPQIRFIQSKKLPFPSASALEYYRGELFVFGDDAPYAVVTDTAFRVLDTIPYLPGTARIARYSKPDIEAIALDSSNSAVFMEAWSSGSAANRNYRLRIDPLQNKLVAIDSFQYQTFVRNLKGIPVINMEGATRVPFGWLAANRANVAQPKTWLLLWEGQPFSRDPELKELELHMPAGAGVSALTYFPEKDRLLFVVSEEATASATGDGAIGESWLCWIDRISVRWKANELKLSGKLRLADVDASMSRQKVEGITVHARGEQMDVYLCADNDDGLSSFFQLRWMDEEQ